MKARYILAGLLVVALGLLLARSAPYLTWQPPAAGPETVPDSRTCRGAVHVHLPDDERSFLALVAAARDAGLDFILFAAAGTFDAAADGREGYYTGAGEAALGAIETAGLPVWNMTGAEHPRAPAPRPPLLVLVGAEVPTDRGRLLLAGGPPGTPYPLTRRSATLVQAVRRAGGVALALRPCRQPVAPGSVPSPERPDPPAGVAGVEAISLAADFTSPLYYPLAEATVLSLLNPAGGLARLAERPARGHPPAAGLDWPGPAAPFGGIGLGTSEILGSPAPPGAVALGWVVTRLRLARPLGRRPGTFAADRQAVIQALATGASSAEVDAWGRDGGLVARQVGPDGRLVARAPSGARSWLVWRRDGAVADAGPGPERTLVTPPAGTWRAEGYLRREDLGLPGPGWVLWSVSPPVQVEARISGEAAS